MYRIREEHIAQKTTENGLELPRSVDMACPFCGRQVNFQLTSWTAAERAFARFTNAHCPGCRRLSSFLWVGMPPEDEEHLDETTVEYRLYIHPTPRSVREPLAGIDSLRDFGGALARAYRSAVAAYDAGQWVASIVLVGRVLEGIVKAIVPESERGKTLASQIVELPNYRDLEQPILTLADAIRRGRNLPGHFEGSLETDQEIAEMALDLLDNLIEYLFLVPDRIQRLRDRLAPEEP